MKGISSKTLARRLKELEKDGILERKAYNEIPPRVEYKMTKKGQEFLFVYGYISLFIEFLNNIFYYYFLFPILLVHLFFIGYCFIFFQNLVYHFYNFLLTFIIGRIHHFLAFSLIDSK